MEMFNSLWTLKYVIPYLYLNLRSIGIRADCSCAKLKLAEKLSAQIMKSNLGVNVCHRNTQYWKLDKKIMICVLIISH
jgi:hypothetical protein